MLDSVVFVIVGRLCRMRNNTLIKARLCAALQAAHIKPWQCQAALAAMQFAFCLGTVYLKSSLQLLYTKDRSHFHPIIYAFLREAVAGPIMCAIAYIQTSEHPYSFHPVGPFSTLEGAKWHLYGPTYQMHGYIWPV